MINPSGVSLDMISVKGFRLKDGKRLN